MFFKRSLAVFLILLITLSSPVFASEKHKYKHKYKHKHQYKHKHRRAVDCDYWEIGLMGGAFQFAPDDRRYAVDRIGFPINPLLTNLVSGNATYLMVNPKYRFGGGMDLVYRPACTPCRFLASYFQGNSNGTSFKETNFAGGEGEENIGAYLWPSDINTPLLFKNAYATLQTKYRFAMLAIGYPVCGNDCFSFILNGGFAYCDFQQNIAAFYENNLGGGTDGSNVIVNLNSKFKGFGPTVGGQAEYTLFCGFSLMANLQYSAFWGDQKGSYFGQRSIPAIPASTQTIAMQYITNRILVSQIQSDLSLAYRLEFSDSHLGTINLGWRFTKLFNSRDAQIFAESGTTNSIGIMSNSTFQGPFVRVALKFRG